MRVEVRKLGRHLQGKSAGRKDFGLLCNQLARARHGEIVFLDFEGVETVNGSWLNTAVGPLFRWAAESQNDYYPVFSAFPVGSLDELDLIATINRQCYLVSKTSNTIVDEAIVVGNLDPSLKNTLERVCESGQVTGAELARQSPDAGIQATAWNNRLRDLFVKRLLIRRKEGRQQLYGPIVRSIVFHEDCQSPPASN